MEFTQSFRNAFFLSLLVHAALLTGLVIPFYFNAKVIRVHPQSLVDVSLVNPAPVNPSQNSDRIKHNLNKKPSKIKPQEKKIQNPKVSLPEKNSSTPSAPRDSAASDHPAQTTSSPPSQNNIGSRSRLTGSADPMSLYVGSVLNLIESHKKYPPSAQRKREEGRVVLSVRLSHTGEVLESKIIEPSSYSNLNDAATDIIHSINRFPPFPPEIKLTSITIKIPVEYKIQ